MRTKVVVLSPPRFDLFSGIVKRQEPVRVQALVAERAVKRLDKRVVGRTAGTREVERDLMLVRPPVEGSAGEFSAVTRPYPFRDAMTGRELLQDRDDPLALDALVGVDRQAFSSVLIDDGEGSKTSTVKERI